MGSIIFYSPQKMNDKFSDSNRAWSQELAGIIKSLQAFQKKLEQPNSSHAEGDFIEFRKAAVRRKLAQPASKCEYTTKDGRVKIVCMVSKEQTSKPGQYWYTFRKEQVRFLEAGTKGFVVIVCGSEDNVLEIPWIRWERLLTQIKELHGRWQIHILREAHRYTLRTDVEFKDEDLTEYSL